MILFGRKLGRDLREHWAQFIAVSLMAALSVLIFSGLEGGWRGIQAELDSFAAEQEMPDAWVTGYSLAEDDAEQIEDLDGVDQASLVASVSVTRTDSSSEDDLSLSTRDEAGINAPYSVDGAPVSDEDGVWLDEAYAEANNIGAGDEITVSRGGTDTSLRVKGLILQPDKIAYTGTGLVAPDPASFGYGIVSDQTATELAGAEPVEQTITILGDPGVVHAEAPGILGDRYGSFSDRDTHPHVATAYERVSQIQSLSYLFSSLFLLVALLSIFTSIRRLTDIQRGEVATLKALGHSNRLIGTYFTAVGIVAVLIGVLAGLGLTPLLSRYVLSTQQGSFSLPAWTTAYTPASAVLPVLLIVVCILASWTATRPMRKATPAEGMRPDIGRARRSLLERLPTLWQRLPYGSRWAIRDASGNPVRVVMGIVATTGCMMLLVTGFGMPDTLNQQVKLSYSEQYRYDTRLSISPLATEAMRERIEDEAGSGQWVHQSSVQLGPEDGTEHTLTVLGTGDLFRLLDRDGDVMPVTDEGAVITDRLSDSLDLNVGDSVMITTSDGSDHEVTITAVSAISEPQGIVLTEEAWSDVGGEFFPTSYLTEEAADEDVQELPGVTGDLSLEEQEANAQSLVDSLASVFTLIKVFAIILAVVVLYNLGALSFTERIRDYATLRVLGFHHGELRSLAGRENITTTLIGWLAGIPAGWWFLGQYVGLFSTDRASYLPSVSIASLAIASAITIFFAMTATLLLTRRIKGIDMTSALKGVE
ncbi:ABC transporter permease [Auritidibacter ignavus]|uniref:ABC transporter permease n=1 Tax=Auritidibacter ignavus TaxID=678932 RepID=UPI0024496707|nr:ABC transporter permease [Auritidibacter ignavus]WGH90603.1 ABC transporter permease [Auritidibacter ignavus]